MPRGKKICKNCSALNYAFSKQCTFCGDAFVKKSSGRPSGTKASDGCSVGTSGGRPSGTKASDGCSSGGRPSGTKASDGCSVGRNGGRRRVKQIVFDESIELPSEWDLSEETLNLNEELLSACARRICQQRTFDGKSLGVGVCYGCGHVLFTSIHTFLIDKPNGFTEEDAPANAYLEAVPNCTLSFMYTERGNSTKERWYSCDLIVAAYAHLAVLFRHDDDRGSPLAKINFLEHTLTLKSIQLQLHNSFYGQRNRPWFEELWLSRLVDGQFCFDRLDRSQPSGKDVVEIFGRDLLGMFTALI